MDHCSYPVPDALDYLGKGDRSTLSFYLRVMPPIHPAVVSLEAFGLSSNDSLTLLCSPTYGLRRGVDANTKKCTMDEPAFPLRLSVLQPALPAYRIPLFKALAGSDAIDLRVFFESVEGLANSPAIGFAAENVARRDLYLGGLSAHWSNCQVHQASRRRSSALVLPWNTRYLSLVPALLRARQGGVRTVLWGHGFSKEESPRRQRLRDSLARLSDAVLFYDRVTEAEWRKRNPEQAKKAFTAPNAIDTAPVDAAIAGWDARALHDFRLAEGLLRRKILLFCSRLDPANRVDLLIKSLPALRERVPDVLACVIGAGSRELTRLKELAERLERHAAGSLLGANLRRSRACSVVHVIFLVLLPGERGALGTACDVLWAARRYLRRPLGAEPGGPCPPRRRQRELLPQRLGGGPRVPAASASP